MYSNNKVVSNIFLSLVEITTFIVLFYIFRKTIIEDFKVFKKEYKKKLDTGFKYYFLGFFIMVVSNLIIAFIFKGIATNEAANREYLKDFPFFSMIAMVIVGPSIEEIVFRLGFRKAFKSCIPYVLFSALFFGGLHVYSAFQGMNMSEIIKNWYQFLYIVPYSALGFAFAKAYYETDNILTTMTVHTLHNAFTILLILCLSR